MGHMDIGQLFFQKGEQIFVVPDRYFFLQDLVPGFLGIGLPREFEPSLPVGQDARVLEDGKFPLL